MAFVITTHQQPYVEEGRTRMTAVLELTHTADQAAGGEYGPTPVGYYGGHQWLDGG